MTTSESPSWSPDSPHFAAYQRWKKQHPEQSATKSGDGLVLLEEREDIALAEESARHELVKQGLPTEWSKVGLVFEDQYLAILRDAVRFPNGDLGTYLRVFPSHLDKTGVAILPVCQGKVVLLHHFRHATRSWHWEIPRGFGSDRDPEQSAIAELDEELKAVPTRLIDLGTFHVDSGMLWHEAAVFLAEIPEFRMPADTREPIDQVRAVAIADLERDIADNQITDSFTIVAVARAKLRGLL